jgi:hypothetical protein
MLTIHNNVTMYTHGIEYCGIQDNIYGTSKYMIQEWIKNHPTKPVCRALWGTFRCESLRAIYFVYLYTGTFVFVIWAIIIDEEQRIRWRRGG